MARTPIVRSRQANTGSPEGSASPSLWALPPRDLAVTAPPGPPADAAEFLARLDHGWLERAYGGDWPRHSGRRGRWYLILE